MNGKDTGIRVFINMLEIRECCCFTGHRHDKLGAVKDAVIKRVDIEIDIAFQEGKSVFISGMATGFDVWAAMAVLNRKSIYDMKLVCALPYPEFCEKRYDSDICREILANADLVKSIGEHYFRGVYQVRNQWMVDCSSRVIAAYDGSVGGTRNTINYAKKKGVQIINVMEPETMWIDESFFEIKEPDLK